MPAFWILALGALALGSIFGSFLNAILFRFNTGRSALRGRSRCMRCGHTLEALDLVPVFSYLFIGGRCRHCGARISAQYPLVECAGALLSLGLFLKFFPPDATAWSASDLLQYAFWLFAWLVVLFIVVYDVRHMIIPWSASLPLLLLALIHLLASHAAGWPTLWAGPALALPLFLISLVSWGRWMGWADSFFELSLGWLLGLSAGATALLLGIWLGAAVGIAAVALNRRATMNLKSEIPFAPFLALGALIAFFLHVDFFATLALF